jgi:DNA-binding response OmpR family regulator
LPRILIIDDDPLIRSSLSIALRRQGHEIDLARNGAEGLERFQAGGHDVVVTDILMPEREGIETIRALRRAAPGLRIVAMSGGGTGYDVLDIARRLGADRTIAKPFGPQQLMAVIDELLAIPPG